MECNRLNENVVAHAAGLTAEDVPTGESPSDSPFRRKNCAGGWTSPNKIHREGERLRARQTACVLVRSRSEQRLNTHSNAKSPSKSSRRKERECRSLRSSPTKARRARTTKSNEPEEDNRENDDDVPDLLRQASDELLKFFDDEEGKDKMKERGDKSDAPSSLRDEEDEISPSEKCDHVEGTRRKSSIQCRTFAHTQSPSKTNRGLGIASEHGYKSPEKRKMGGDVSVRLSSSSHSPRRRLSQFESPCKAAQSAARRHKGQLSSKYNDMIEKSRHGKAIKTKQGRQSPAVDAEAISVSTEKSSMTACLQFVPNSSKTRHGHGETIDETSITPPITNKKCIQFHSSALVQNKIQLARSPVSPKKPSSRPRELKREISVNALKATFCQEHKEAKESPVAVKRNLGAKKIFGNMMGAFQARSD